MSSNGEKQIILKNEWLQPYTEKIYIYILDCNHNTG